LVQNQSNEKYQSLGWDIHKKGAAGYYHQCNAYDEALALWALHFKDSQEK